MSTPEDEQVTIAARPQEMQTALAIRLVKLFTEMQIQDGILALNQDLAMGRIASAYRESLNNSKVAEALDLIWDIYLREALRKSSVTKEQLSTLVTLLKEDTASDELTKKLVIQLVEQKIPEIVH